MEMMLIHPESAAYFHPMEQDYYHPMDTEVYHSGMLRVQGGPNKECETARNVMAGVVPVSMNYYYLISNSFFFFSFGSKEKKINAIFTGCHVFGCHKWTFIGICSLYNSLYL